MTRVVRKYELLIEVEVPSSSIWDDQGALYRRADRKFKNIERGLHHAIDWEDATVLKEYKSEYRVSGQRKEERPREPEVRPEDYESSGPDVVDTAVALGALAGLAGIAGASAYERRRSRKREERTRDEETS